MRLSLESSLIALKLIIEIQRNVCRFHTSLLGKLLYDFFEMLSLKTKINF